MLIAAGSSLLLGNDLLPWMVLALGGAMFAGNLAAVIRPPERRARKEGELERAPVARSFVMAGLGLLAAVWALASLLTA